MKKFLASAFLILASISAGFAFGQYSLFDDAIDLELVPSDELYPEAIFDMYSPQTDFSLMDLASGQANPSSIRTSSLNTSTGKQEYVDLPYSDGFADDDDSYLRMKTGANISLLRLGFLDQRMEIEASIQGALDTIFAVFGGSTNLGFDGTYFAGANMRLFNTVSLRFGIHHFSGHYGDEVLDDFYNHNFPDGDTSFTRKDTVYQFNNLVEYVRDNSFLAGISIQTPWLVRLYCELELPKSPSWIRPVADIPADYSTFRNDEQSLIEAIGGDENFTASQLEADEASKRSGLYRAMRIQTGAEVLIPVKYVGTVFAGINVQLHQDGQTLHEVGGYSPDNPWEVEVTVGGGLDIAGSGVRVEAYYHDGRMPLLNWYYDRVKFISVGLSIDS
jgi:hypothetical protein